MFQFNAFLGQMGVRVRQVRSFYDLGEEVVQENHQI